LLVVWTLAVAPHSKYGDQWAIYPALLVFPLIVLWHGGLVVYERPRLPFVIYGLLHLTVAFTVWVYCLMKISKDAL